jgi:hypothetical protein
VRTIRLLGDDTSNETPAIPASHRDLVECPVVATLTTVTAGEATLGTQMPARHRTTCPSS